MALDIQTGISIVMNRWLEVRRGELILLVTDENHLREKEAFEHWGRSQDAVLKTVLLNSRDVQQGDVIGEMAELLESANVIVGATDYSFITARPVADAVARGARFLSLPLSCADSSSLLENDFVDMNCAWSRRIGARICISASGDAPRGATAGRRKSGGSYLPPALRCMCPSRKTRRKEN